MTPEIVIASYDAVGCLCSDPEGWRIFLTNGYFSPCFVDLAIFTFPSLLALVCGPFTMSSLAKASPLPENRHPLLSLLKTVSLIAYGAVLLLIVSYKASSVGLWSITFISLAFQTLVFGFVFVIHRLESSRWTSPSDTLLLYWPITVFMNVTQSLANRTDSTALVLYMLLLTLSVVVYVLEYFVPKFLLGGKIYLEEDDDLGVIDAADIYSKIALFWMNPLISLAVKARLTFQSLPVLEKCLAASTSNEKFDKYWSTSDQSKTSSLVKSLVYAFWPRLLIAAACEFFNDFVLMAKPFIVARLITYAKSYYTDDPLPPIYGIYSAFAMLLLTLGNAAIATKIMLLYSRCAVSITGALNIEVFNKALRLSSKSRQGKSIGEIVNIMSVDVNAINNVSYSISGLWDIPFMVIAASWSLYQFIGKSMFVLYGIMIVMTVLNTRVTKFLRSMRRKQMTFKDERVRMTTEILTNIKSLKLYGWEGALFERLSLIRNDQLKNLAKLSTFRALWAISWLLVPYITIAACFYVYAMTSNVPLTPEVLFPALTLINIAMMPFNEMPQIFNTLIDASVSIKRIRDFLVEEELQEDSVIRLPAAKERGEEAVTLEAATFSWDSSEDSAVVLNNINLSLKKGELACVVGRVGAGKTSLIRSILGDLFRKHGITIVRGTVACAPQDPWLMSDTVKANILVGRRYDPEFYQKTIAACALEDDIKILPDGDLTQIGEKGVSLSGGQKARVSLARAVYARADVYLLDDPLSAVDEHVGKHIKHEILSKTGLLSNKAVLLCTNSISVLKQADHIYLLEDKTVAETGRYQDVIRNPLGKLNVLIREFGHNNHEEEVSTLPSELPSGQQSRRGSVASNVSMVTLGKHIFASDKVAGTKTAKSEEISQVGMVKWSTYKRYLKAIGAVPISIACFLLVTVLLTSTATEIWLKEWSEANSETNSNENIGYWIGMYILIALLLTVTSIARNLVTNVWCSLKGARVLHNEMANRVLRAPMRFFETTPVGRIINRFSMDVNSIDEDVFSSATEVLRPTIMVIISVCIVISGYPAQILVMIPLSALYFYFQQSYQPASRELKRLLSVSNSPVYGHFHESLVGSSMIRAYGLVDRFEYINGHNIDNRLRTVYVMRSINSWLTFRHQFVGSLFMFSTAVAILFGAGSKSIAPGMVGLILSYTSTMTQWLSGLVRSMVTMETAVVAVERVLEYCDLEVEAPPIIEGHRPENSWPEDGIVEFNHYSTRYRANLGLVLDDINIAIKSREKIGVVGRTGAGKSSLIMALFRIIEPASGHITIDSWNTADMGVRDLRSHLSIIPQDAQLFVGTVRQNLDPIGLYSDDQLWGILAHSHLKEHVQSMGGLEAEIAESGSNLSAGQRQLMCLGRALLHDSRVLLLDEATASVDVETDKLVQQSIRSEFKDRTIITIAHRINTILDSDRILVLEKGKVAEFDTPKNLLANEESIFYSLCKQGGLLKQNEES